MFGSVRHTTPPEIAAAIPALVKVAQEQYDSWHQGDDDELNGGGICHLIADAMAAVLSARDIACTTVSSYHEVHVYVVAQLPSGVWQVDIRPGVYERGGGYTWTKIPDVTFEAADIEVSRLSSHPRDMKDFVEERQDDLPPADADSGDRSRDTLLVDYNAVGSYRIDDGELTLDGRTIGEMWIGLASAIDHVVISKILILQQYRHRGYARGALAQLTKIADACGYTLGLTPAADFGASVARLKVFYKSLGFVENKGRKRDFAISDSMYRLVKRPAYQESAR